MWDYTDKVREHFLNPKHVGEIAEPDLDATVGNITCGDALRIMVKLDADGRIADAKFQTFGCASAIASSDALIDLILGKTLDEAEAITDDDIADYLGGLPEEKMHCSVMGVEALQKALASHHGRPFEQEDEGTVVCRCFGVTDKVIEKVVREHDLTTVDEVTHYTKAGGGCRGCVPEIEAIIAKVHGPEAGARASTRPAGKPRTNIERIQRVQEVVEQEIRPMVQQDGGDVELIDVDGKRVEVAFLGHCAWCPVSDRTLKGVVQQKLRELVDPDLVVEDVGPRIRNEGA